MTVSHPSYRITPLQVQPHRSGWSEWSDLAGARNLRYEVLEMSLLPALSDEKTASEYKEWYLKGSRVTSVHGAFIDVNPASGDPDIRAVSRKRCHSSCRLASDLNARNVVFHSSCFPFLRGAYLDSWAGQCAEFYEELAETYDMNLFIENSQDVDADPLKELMKRTADPRVGVCLDFGHAHYSRISIEEWFDALADRIGYLHLSDNTGSYDTHLPLGKGTVDWAAADSLWRSLGRQMPVTVEMPTPQDAADSIQFLEEHEYFRAFDAGL